MFYSFCAWTHGRSRNERLVLNDTWPALEWNSSLLYASVWHSPRWSIWFTMPEFMKTNTETSLNTGNNSRGWIGNDHGGFEMRWRGEGWVKLIERNENENRETRQRWRNSTIRYGFSTSPLSVPATFAKSPLAVPAISELMSHSNPFTRTLMRNNVTTNHANKYPITITHSSLQSGGTIKFSCPLKLLYLLLEPPTMTTRTPS